MGGWLIHFGSSYLQWPWQARCKRAEIILVDLHKYSHIVWPRMVVRDKVGRPPGDLRVSKSMECDIFPSVLWHCWLGDRKGIRPVKNWVLVSCLVCSSQIIITNKPTSSFLQARCPSCRPTNSVKALKGKYHIPCTCIPQAHLGVFQLCLRPLIATGYQIKSHIFVSVACIARLHSACP